MNTGLPTRCCTSRIFIVVLVVFSVIVCLFFSSVDFMVYCPTIAEEMEAVLVGKKSFNIVFVFLLLSAVSSKLYACI